MKELLDTDRVNFLVWRYLLESNYRETAAKLQKEWRISQAPHKHFDFAPHVSTYALVTTLNKGLVYEDFQRQFAAQSAQLARDVPATADATQRGVFGPLKFEPSPREDDDDEDEEDESEAEPEAASGQEEAETSRKRQMDQHHLGSLPNGSPAKRPRLSDGYENGADSATTPMEIDRHPDNHAYPSPLEGEQAASPPARTEGPEQATQVDKVYELGHQTYFLPLGGEESLETSPTRAKETPIVLLCEWSPTDPCTLAAAGTDALARVWTISQASAPDSLSDHVNGVSRPFKNLVEDDVPGNATMTAMAWNWGGTAIALAVDAGSKARVSVWGADGNLIDHFDGQEPPITKLRWSPSDSNILAIGPENNGTLVTVFFSASQARSRSMYLDHDHGTEPLDATWTSESDFVICGGDLLMLLRCTHEGIFPRRKFSTGMDEAFSQVRYDWRSKMLATSSDKGTIDLWDEYGVRRSISAHIGTITSLQWQPLDSEPPPNERLLASGGEDGAICIWNVRNSENKPKYSMTMDNPIAALSMTPDGAFIAGATSSRVLVWRPGDPFPRASWNKGPNPAWASDGDEEDQTSLSWDADGQRLVYGGNSRLAVINFR